jgi:signal transduction histidine kinase
VAITKGQLNQRIEVRSSDETRLLAESFNQMSDRLREQIAREAESRQFESFMRLSAMLTHDLKNSISALSLIVSNMERRAHREEFRADAMRALTEATDKLRALVAKLSEPVRSLSGEFKRPRPLDIIPIIKRSLAATAEQASSTHEIEVHLPDSLIAVADDERIEKVLDNLVLNALEAMGAKEGKLTVEAGEAEKGFVFFSVADTGPGMTEEFQRTKLFRPFGTTKAKGVGLGLYTCRELIRALGGRIEVESERGSGALFRVVLPSGQINGGEQLKSKRTT